MKTPVVSIIVPVFNCRDFLEECVESLVAQDFGKPYEIILIDDGSTDGSDRLCSRLALKYPTLIRTKRFENGGLSVARNRGIEMAQGEYISFVDADDGLAPYGLSVLYSMLEHNPACGMAIGQLYESETFPFNNILPQAKQFHSTNGQKAIINALYQFALYNTSSSGKLYRRDLFDSSQWFKPGTWYEDLEFFPRAFSAAGMIIATDMPIYFYRRNPGSFIHRWSEGRLDVLSVTRDITRWAAGQSPEMERAALSRQFSANYNMFVLACRNGRRDVARECWNFLTKHAWGSITDSNVRLKNRIAALLCPLPFPAAYALFTALSKIV